VNEIVPRSVHGEAMRRGEACLARMTGVGVPARATRASPLRGKWVWMRLKGGPRCEECPKLSLTGGAGGG